MTFAIQLAGGELTIGGVSMHTPAWRVRNPGIVMFDPPFRGTYVPVPGLDGETVVPMRGTSAQWSLDFMLCGDVDHTGSAYSDRQTGLVSNLNYLRTNAMTSRSLTGNRTRVATYTPPGGSALTADVHCWLVPPEDFTQPVWEMTLELRVPAGVFA